MTMRKPLFMSTICTIFVLLAVGFSVDQTRLVAQTLAPNQKISDDDGAKSGPGSGAASAGSNGGSASNPAKLNAEILKELEQMRLRIQELEAQLKAQQGPSDSASVGHAAESKESSSRSSLVEVSAAKPPVAAASTKQTQAAPATSEPAAPFAYADWTWLNGNPRNKDVVWDSKFFTPEIRLDANFISSLNHPRDDSLGGSTETFRSNEVQIEQISLGGDFHWDNVRARMLTMAGMFGVTTPRNDASPGRGQWDLRGAYKYFSEANGGYHFNV